MKLALVVHDFDPGYGQGRYAIELARRFAPEHRVEIFANTFGVAAEPGWTFIRVPAWRRTALGTVFSFLAGAELRLRGRTHDLVHAQGLTSWRADVITAHMCNAARTRIAPPTGLRHRLFPALVNPVEARFYRQRRARHLIAISRKVADEITAHYGWRKPVSIIPHGIDTGHFRPAADGAERSACRRHFRLPDTAWVWLFVGEATKGVAEVVRQLPAFPEARFLVVSRSDPAPFTGLAAQLGVGDRLHFWGPEREVARAYRAADAFVYPSNYDTFGMVVAEALASGLPAIVSRDVGAGELIEDGRSGFIVETGAPASLAAALTRLRGDPRTAGDIARAGREVALAHTWDRCAADTLQALRRVAGQE